MLATRLRKTLSLHSPLKRRFSRMERLLEEQAKEEAARKKHIKFPILTTLLCGTSIGIYYCWQNWTRRQCKVNFVFTETNFYNLGRYHCFLLSPLSFEHNFFFYSSLPGLFYSGMLIERYLGARWLLFAYLANCAVSAATTTYVHRKIGFHKVQ